MFPFNFLMLTPKTTLKSRKQKKSRNTITEYRPLHMNFKKFYILIWYFTILFSGLYGKFHDI